MATFSFFGYVGQSVLSWVLWLWRAVMLCVLGIFNALSLRFYVRQLPTKAFELSFLSLSVISLTSFFSGAVLTLQAYRGLKFFASPESIANIVMSGILREIGPVLTGLVIAGRIASSIAAELSTMKTSDQTNALITLSIDPIKFLVIPRVVVGVAILPVVLTISDIISVLGSHIVMTLKFGYSPEIYLTRLAEYFYMKDYLVGILKASAFGFIITLTGCACGMMADKSSEGVGKATTDAVVISSILVLVTNYFITLLAL